MLTKLERDYQEAMAQKAAQQRNDDQLTVVTEYDRQLLHIQEVLGQLKDTQSIVGKIELKRKVLPEFDGYIEGALQDDAKRQDDVLIHLMIWNVDIAQFDRAFVIAKHAIAHGWEMPQRFSRDVKNFVIEECAEHFLKKPAKAENLATLLDALAIVEGMDMLDQVMAKLHRALGECFENDNNLAEVIKHFGKAIDLNSGIGLKGRLKDVQRNFEKQNADTESNPTDDPTEAETVSQVDAETSTLNTADVPQSEN